MKVLLAIDGSACSQLALEQVARQPWPLETIVYVVTADPPVPSSWSGAVTAFDVVVSGMRREVTQQLAIATARLRDLAPGLRIESQLLEGEPKDAILKAAEKLQADLIVLGSHGHGPVRRFFLGSVSQYVANNAPCSVLIVRSTPEEGSATSD